MGEKLAGNMWREKRGGERERDRDDRDRDRRTGRDRARQSETVTKRQRTESDQRKAWIFGLGHSQYWAIWSSNAYLCIEGML